MCQISQKKNETQQEPERVIETSYENGCRIIKGFEFVNGEKVLVGTSEYDKEDRIIDWKAFDYSGQELYHGHKEYSENGYVETYRSESCSYVRKSTNFEKDGYKHRIETYVSQTHPDSNYEHEFISNKDGDVIKMITNGKVVWKR